MVTNDPFEIAFFDYLNGNTQSELIVLNNKGDEEIMPVSYFFRSYNEMPELEKLALGQCSGKVLDIGAGSGCHSLYLQQNGVDVTALDIRPGFVEVMKRQGIENIKLADIQEFSEKKFDTLLMLMNGIGFTKNFHGLQKFLKQSKTLLNKNGQILLDSSDLMYLYTEDDGTVRIDLNEQYYGEVEYRVIYKDQKGIPFKWLFVDFSNLSHFAMEAGYRTELLYEDDHFNFLARLY